MGRFIAGVVVGYIVMFVFVFVTFTVSYLAMGTEGAFKPGSYDVSALWMLLSIVLGIVAGILAGVVASTMARRYRGAVGLAVVVLVLGLAMAIPAVTGSDEDTPQVRAADVGITQAMADAKQPTWMVLLNPVLGAISVLVGGKLRRSQA
jgi:hypothetical protein